MKVRMAVLCGLALLLGGCKVSQPGSVERRVATEIKHEVTIGGKDWTNPIPDTPQAVAEGQEHFGHHCGFCHGLDGHATGVPFAQKMSPPVPDLASPDVQGYSDGQLKWIIQNGIEPSGMPGWNGILNDDEMWNVVRFLRHLPAKGSLGVPAYFREAEEEHQHARQEEKTETHQHQHK
jgi:mono/diheme cytochrome c family protein